MRFLFLYLLLFHLPYLASAQVAQGFNYQAVIRDDLGEPLLNTVMNIDVDIFSNQIAGDPIYEEQFTGITTDEFGVLNLVIGRGANLGIPFSSINWGAGPHSLELILSFGDERIRLPATPLQSVPYALVAESLARPLWELGASNSAVSIGDRVGIGTTVPGNQLSIQGASSVGANLTTEGAADVFLDLIRGTDNRYTDWRLINDSGLLSMRYALDGFESSSAGTPALSVTSAGRVAIGDFDTPATQLHVRGRNDQQLRIQSDGGSAGLDYYSPGPDFRMVNEEGRFRFQRSTNGFNSATDIFDVQTDNTLRIRQTLNMADQGIVNTADPSGPQHVVTLRYMEDYVEDQLEQQSMFPEQLSSELNDVTFDACANHCRTLTEGGFTNWGVPSLDQLSQFAGGIIGDPSSLWTTTGAHARTAYAHRINGGTFNPPPSFGFDDFTGRFTMRLNTGAVQTATRDNDSVNCRCVR